MNNADDDKIEIHARMYRKVYGSLCRQLEKQKKFGAPGPLVSSLIDDILLVVAEEIANVKNEIRQGHL